MAAVQTPSIFDTATIKIIKVRGTSLMWYTIYADDIAICSIFGEHPEEHLPNIISEEETMVHNLRRRHLTERTPENGV